jgi:hypothetical protein
MTALEVATQLGTKNGAAGTELGLIDEARLMDALGETGPTTEENHPQRLALLQAYSDAYRWAAGICFECGDTGATVDVNAELLCTGCAAEYTDIAAAAVDAVALDRIAALLARPDYSLRESDAQIEAIVRTTGRNAKPATNREDKQS